MRRARATRHNEPYEPEDVTELIVEARKAFAWHLPEDRRNLTDLKDLLDRFARTTTPLSRSARASATRRGSSRDTGAAAKML